MKVKSKMILLLLACIMLLDNGFVSHAAKLTKTRQRNADRIYKECKEHWREYGCLPSVCISIGIVESGLGETCRSNNWWGLHGGARSYSSFEAGMRAYAKTVGNKSYYGDAKGQTNYKKQLKCLSDGGYCASGGYYRKNKKIIRKYKLYKYDVKMFTELSGQKVVSKKSPIESTLRAKSFYGDIRER